MRHSTEKFPCASARQHPVPAGQSACSSQRTEIPVSGLSGVAAAPQAVPVVRQDEVPRSVRTQQNCVERSQIAVPHLTVRRAQLPEASHEELVAHSVPTGAKTAGQSVLVLHWPTALHLLVLMFGTE